MLYCRFLKFVKYSFWILFIFFIVSSCSPNREEESLVNQRLDSLFVSWKEVGRFNGNVLIELPDTTITKVMGVSRHNTGMLLNDTDAFYIGSLAKQFTAMAILISVENNKLSLDDTLGIYFPDLPDFTHAITIRQMLNHTSGLPDYYNLGVFESGFTNTKVIDAMKNIDNLDFPSGSKYSYSNSAYVLLSVIVEKVSGFSFKDFLSENIFNPLKMVNTMVYDTTRPRLPPRALGHYPGGTVHDYNAFTTGGGGIFSNIYDLQKWVHALDSGLFIKESLYEQMYLPAQLTDGSLSYYGFGWMLNEENEDILKHSGSLAGFRSYLYRNREKGITIVTLSNFTDDVETLNNEILHVLANYESPL